MRLDVNQVFRFCVLDSVTQQLRISATAATKGAKETYDLNLVGTADLSLADLRVNATLSKEVGGGYPAALAYSLHCLLTCYFYLLLATCYLLLAIYYWLLAVC